MATSRDSHSEPFFSPPSVYLRSDQAYVKGFANFWESKEHADIDLICNEHHKIRAHKILLASQSTFFNKKVSPAMNGGNFIESLKIDADPELLKLCLEFIYTGFLEVSPGKLPLLTSVAEKFKFSLLYNTCKAEEFKDVVPDKSNCLEIMCVGRTTNNKALMKKGKPLALANFIDLIDHPSFNKLSSECLKELVTDPNLKFSAPEQILSAVSQWVHDDLEERQRYLLGLLERISLKDVQPWNIKPYLMFPGFKKDADCEAFLRAAMDGTLSKTAAAQSAVDDTTKQEVAERRSSTSSDTLHSAGVPAVVVDQGTSAIRAGFSGDDNPQIIFPTLIGRQKKSGSADTKQDVYVGEAAQKKRGVLNINNPITRGLVTNWDDLEVIWEHIFTEELNISPQAQPVFITAAKSQDETTKARMSELLFEKFGVPSLQMGTQAVVTLYATGRVTGVMVDSGHGCTQVVPIFNGYSIPSATLPFDIAGIDITQFLETSIMETSKAVKSFGRHIFTEIKEKHCCLTEDSKRPDVNYKLPDGTSISIGKECSLAPEAMFKPSLVGRSFPGLHKTVLKSITACESDIHGNLYSNIILSGGNTRFPGFCDRLMKEMRRDAPGSAIIKMIAPPERSLTWIGASIVSSCSSFDALWLSKELYEEHGKSLIQQKVPCV